MMTNPNQIVVDKDLRDTIIKHLEIQNASLWKGIERLKAQREDLRKQVADLQRQLSREIGKGMLEEAKAEPEYRFLEIGETIEAGDEWHDQFFTKEWRPVDILIGLQANIASTIRRRVS